MIFIKLNKLLFKKINVNYNKNNFNLNYFLKLIINKYNVKTKYY